ncbi:MAG TPA: hypothetical protein VHH35_20945 [Pyrinomonadaceae bacterium]|nr:hypothetical protein [Pyrinomonadaceae bacterium]
MAQGFVNRVVPASSFALGVSRAIVHGTFLISVIATSFSALGKLPPTILRPTGAMKILPWSLYDQLLTPAGMTILQTALVLSLLASTAGVLTSVSTKTSLLLVVFYQGLLRSFGHFNHDEMLGVYCLVVLAFTPCGDAFSVDAWKRTNLLCVFAPLREMTSRTSTPIDSENMSRKGAKTQRRERPLWAYAYPILLMQLLMAWVYFSSALIKLRVAGLNYLSADNLPSLAILHSLDNLHDTQFRLAFWLPQVRSYLPLAVGLVLAWELLFPLAVFWRRARWWILGAGVAFHLSTLFFMNIFFPHQLALYLLFVNWDKVAQLARASRPTAPVNS